MNKCLLRKLKPFLLSVEPQDARQWTQAFDLLERITKKGRLHFETVLRAFTLIAQHTLRERGLPVTQLIQQFSKLETITKVWLEAWDTLLATFFSPAILLLLFLKTTLNSNLVPERQEFVFEKIKKILADRYWPPQRQRCDFIPAPVIN